MEPLVWSQSQWNRLYNERGRLNSFYWDIREGISSWCGSCLWPTWPAACWSAASPPRCSRASPSARACRSHPSAGSCCLWDSLLPPKIQHITQSYWKLPLLSKLKSDFIHTWTGSWHQLWHATIHLWDKIQTLLALTLSLDYVNSCSGIYLHLSELKAEKHIYTGHPAVTEQHHSFWVVFVAT